MEEDIDDRLRIQSEERIGMLVRYDLTSVSLTLLEVVSLIQNSQKFLDQASKQTSEYIRRRRRLRVGTLHMATSILYNVAKA